MELISATPKNENVKVLTPKVMVFGDGIIWSKIGLEWGPHDGVSILIRRDTRIHSPSAPCEGTEEGSHPQARKKSLTRN